MIANAVKNIFNASGMLFPNNPNTAIAKAMSVAIGIPAPLIVEGEFKLNVI